MKRIAIVSILLLGTVVFMSNAASAFSGTIEDNYWGGGTHKYSNGQDVIGATSKFDIDRMEVEVTDDLFTVKIFTNYVNNVGASGTELGDLFISTDGWNPFGSAADMYKNDQATNGEDWEYAFDVSSGQLYDISDAQDSRLTAMDVYGPTHSSYGFRSGQEVQIDPSGLTAVGAGNVSMTSEYLAISFDTGLLDIADASSLGFHWDMTCGNDVIEGAIDVPPTSGSTPVPEPGTLVLLGLGSLAGFGFLRKRR